MVFIAGVYKTPGADYTLDGDYINFTSAPASGTNNIVVHHIGNGVMATQVPADGAVSGNKLGINSIRANNIVAGQITGNLIDIFAVSGNNIGLGAITGNNFAQAITGNLIGTTAITSNHIVVGAITGNLLSTNIINSNNIVDGAIQGNDIAVNAISANQITVGAITGNLIAANTIRGNNIVAGQITGNLITTGAVSSNTLASNLSISTVRVNETTNINVATSGPSGTINIDVANSTVYVFGANSTANLSFNLRANTQNTFDSIIQTGQSISVAIAVKHGLNRHTANLFIDGTLLSGFTMLTNQTGPFTANNIIYAGNTRPAFASLTGLYPEVQLFNYSVFKTAANQYTVVASNTIFGIG
jgi:hypothetical protein